MSPPKILHGRYRCLLTLPSHPRTPRGRNDQESHPNFLFHLSQRQSSRRVRRRKRNLLKVKAVAVSEHCRSYRPETNSLNLACGGVSRNPDLFLSQPTQSPQVSILGSFNPPMDNGTFLLSPLSAPTFHVYQVCLCCIANVVCPSRCSSVLEQPSTPLRLQSQSSISVMYL